MTRTAAIAIGMMLAAGLAVAAPGTRPTDIVERHFAATDEAGVAAAWHDWHPEAIHHIRLRTGTAAVDFDHSYALSDWDALPGWTGDPGLSAAFRGYEETARTDPQIHVDTGGGGTVVTASTTVSYVWDGYRGVMTQTDRFDLVPLAGRPVIRTLTTTYDYR